MSYNMYYKGSFELSKPLSIVQKKEIDDFAEERHSSELTGSYYCGWVSNEMGTHIEPNDSEGFHEAAAWLEYLIENFFEKWGMRLNGSVTWTGEAQGDAGVINAKDSVVSTCKTIIIDDLKQKALVTEAVTFYLNTLSEEENTKKSYAKKNALEEILQSLGHAQVEF